MSEPLSAVPETLPKPKISLDEAIRRTVEHIRPLFRPGQVVELRALNVEHGNGGSHTESGFFDLDHLPQMVRAAFRLTRIATGVYFTLNPLREDILVRRANKVGWAKGGELAKDADVALRQWLLVDIDPTRDPFVSATDAEKGHARAVAERVREFLRQRGWPEPILGDSGNGFHLLYRVDLPAEDDRLVERVLAGLGERFDTPEATVDRKVFNPSRIGKLPGTRARKGTSVPERPHRVARLLEVPEDAKSALDLPVVSRELLDALAGPKGGPVPPRSDDPPVAPKTDELTHSRLKVAEWLTDLGVGFRTKDRPDGLGRTVYVLACCPFDASHADPDACVMQSPEGKMSAQCFHNGCAGKGWQAFKQILGVPKPHHFDPPLRGKRGASRAGSRTLARNGGGADEPPRKGDGDAASSGNGFPTIQGNKRQLRDVTADALRALIAANDPPALFQRGGVLTRIRPAGDDEPPALEPLTDPALRGCLARVANWFRVRDTNHGEVTEDAAPPTDVVRDLATLPRWEGIPPLRQLIETPVFDALGRLVATPGYHAESRLWYEPSPELVLPPAESLIDEGGVAWAREFLVEEFLGDFPFADDASRAHALSALLVPFVRPMIDGPVPLHLFDAPTEGTGKTLLATAISLVATGREVEPIAEATCDDEWRKRITAVLAEGPSIVLLDNLNRTLDSGSLASVLTNRRWKDRILGVSKTARLPNTALWLASGNNTRLSRELIRRTAFCRLDAKVDVPWEREGFRHPNLIRWVKADRVRLVRAALTLCQSWIAAGRKPGSGKMGMFEGWVETVGGILEHAGVPGFLCNATQFRAQRSDAASEWRAFVKAWWDRFGPQAVGVAELFPVVAEEQLLDHELGDKGERSQRIRLGQALCRYAERVCGDFRIALAESDHKERQRFRLERVRDSHAPSAAGEPTLAPR